MGANERVQAVKSAVVALERIGAAFTVIDIAERSGVSRATIYRSAELRRIIGARGNVERTVPEVSFQKVEAKCAQQRTSIRKLRQELKELEASWQIIRERAVTSESEVERLREENKELMARLSKRGIDSMGSERSLLAAASDLGASEAKRVRRQLARVLHPDLFASDIPLAKIATELLKLVNGICKTVES